MDMLRFGTYYGGWWIPQVAPEDGPAFCVGAGLDVSFDRELLRLGYRVYTVDPTPASLAYLAEHAPDLTILPVGVWRETGELSFIQDGEWSDSWAIGTGGALTQTLPVKSIHDLLASVDETHAGILKLDIEGAEHEVIRSLLSDNVPIGCLCVEFDDQRLHRVVRTVRLLRRHGYDLYQQEGWNYTFVKLRE